MAKCANGVVFKEFDIYLPIWHQYIKIILHIQIKAITVCAMINVNIFWSRSRLGVSLCFCFHAPVMNVQRTQQHKTEHSSIISKPLKIKIMFFENKFKETVHLKRTVLKEFEFNTLTDRQFETRKIKTLDKFSNIIENWNKYIEFKTVISFHSLYNIFFISNIKIQQFWKITRKLILFVNLSSF